MQSARCRKDRSVAVHGESVEDKRGSLVSALTWIARIVLSLLIPLAAFFVLYEGFLFLRQGNAPKWVMALVAIAWGV